MARTTAEEKYQAKQRRRRGLQKTRFYCQVCERQCLDENGFKCHVQSEVHMRNLKSQLESHGGSARGVVKDYSDRFVKDFVGLLRKSHGTKMIGANRFYQEYIRDKDHVHLNSTRWKFLASAVSFMRDEKILNVVETNGLNDEQFHIGYLDNSPAAIKRRAKAQMAVFEQEKPANELDPELETQMARAEALKANMDLNKTKTTQPTSQHLDPKPKTKLSFGLKAKLNAKAKKSL